MIRLTINLNSLTLPLKGVNEKAARQVRSFVCLVILIGIIGSVPVISLLGRYTACQVLLYSRTPLCRTLISRYEMPKSDVPDKPIYFSGPVNIETKYVV